MRGHERYPVPRVHPLKRAAAAAAMIAVTLAGCTAKPRSGSAEHPAATASAATAPQIAGLTAMNLVFVANPGGHDQIFEQPLSSPDAAPVPLTPDSCDSMNPQLSPAGDELVYYSGCADGHNQILTFNMISHAQTQLTHDADVQNYDPTYVLGTDGRPRIDWKRSDPDGNYGELWEMNADGSDPYDVTPGFIAAKREIWKPSPTGPTDRIVGVREHQGNPDSDDLYSLNVITGAMRRLTDNGVPDWYPSVSQHGMVVFVTKKDGHDVLATMNLDGKNRRVIVDMPGDSDDPSWSPDGSTVVFINNRGGKYSVYAYEVATGKLVRLYDGNKAGNGRALAPILVPAAG